MKKIVMISVLLLLVAGSLSYANMQSEDGLVEDIKYMILPDPMANNTYDEGQCTHYVFSLVKDDMNMIENRWGDAEHWAARAEADGYTVDGTPTQGAILQTSRGEIGHVAYVTSVNDDSIEVTEMNFYEPYEITERTIEMQDVGSYNFIQPKDNPRPKDTVG